MRRVYYGVALLFTGLWAFFAPEDVTDFVTYFARHGTHSLNSDSVTFLVGSQGVLAIPAWLSFWAWRRSNPKPSIASRLPIYGAACIGSLATCGIFLQEFGVPIIIAALLANAAVALCLFSPSEIPAAFAEMPAAIDETPAAAKDLLLGRGKSLERLQILSQAMLDEAALYPKSFMVKPGDIGVDPVTNKFYRINSNGVAVDVSKWHFDADTGEFYKITKKFADHHNIFIRTPYDKRFVQYHSGIVPTQKVLCYTMGSASCIVAAILGYYIFNGDESIRGLITFLFFFVLLMGACLLLAPRDLTEAKIIGPQPLKLKSADNFGPGKVSPVNDGGIDPVLAYKPSGDSFEAPGDRTKQDVQWFREKAERGEPNGQYWLGCAYMLGEGIQHDEDIAIEWIRKAALQNYPDACRGLAIAYEDGRGSLKASKEEARKWYQKAADLGILEARVWLAKNR